MQNKLKLEYFLLAILLGILYRMVTHGSDFAESFMLIGIISYFSLVKFLELKVDNKNNIDLANLNKLEERFKSLESKFNLTNLRK